MTVYEATKRSDYRRIVRFILKQPRQSLPIICWVRGFNGKGLLEEQLEEWKSLQPYLHIFWVEDNERQIRCVLSVHERMSVEKVPIATNAVVVLENKDWEANDGTYFKELVDHIIRVEAPKYGLVRGQFFGVKKFVDWFRELHADCVTIEKEGNFPIFGKVSLYNVDFTKFRGT